MSDRKGEVRATSLNWQRLPGGRVAGRGSGVHERKKGIGTTPNFLEGITG